MTSHAYCYKNIPQECTFGNLEPIYLPPHAVSIPRTEVPMEAIIGVQVRRKEVATQHATRVDFLRYVKRERPYLYSKGLSPQIFILFRFILNQYVYLHKILLLVKDFYH